MRRILFFASRLVFGSSENRRRVFPIVLGMAVAIIPLLVMQMAAVGVIMGISARYIETDSFHLRAESIKHLSLSGTEEVRTALDEFSPSITVYSEWEAQGVLIGKEIRSPVQIRAIHPDLWAEDERFSRYMTIVQGQAQLSDPQSILLSAEVAGRIGAIPGDTIALLTVNTWNRTVLPRISRLKVAGIVSSGYQELDRFWVFISLDAASKILPPDGRKQFLKMKVEDPYVISHNLLPQLLPLPGQMAARRQMHSLIAELQAELGSDWQVRTWYQLGIQQFSRFRTTQQLMLFLMILVLCVGAIIVSVFLSRLVVEQSKSISMLKLLGASSSVIFQILLVIGSIIGTVAAILGVSISILIILSINDIIAIIDWVVNSIATFAGRILHISTPQISLLNSELYLERIPVQLQFFSLLIIAVGEIIISTIAGILPARTSFRIRPSGIRSRGL